VGTEENVAARAAPRQEPRALHVPFAWLDATLQHDHQAVFAALTMDVCNGMQTCLQLVHSDLLTRNRNQIADLGQEDAPLLDKAGGERLLLLATAAARMLSERAEEYIDAMHHRAGSQAASGVQS
jgi:hypothetical protein